MDLSACCDTDNYNRDGSFTQNTGEISEISAGLSTLPTAVSLASKVPQQQHTTGTTQPQRNSTSSSRSRRCQVLARGPSCPGGKHISMDQVEIQRPLACSHNCFISTVKITAAGPEVTTSANGAKSFSSASSGRDDPLGVAKAYRKAKLDEDEAKQVELEIKLHQQLSANPHVVPFWAALDTPDSITIITAHCEGDLRGLLDRGALSEAAVKKQVAAPLLLALAEMHGKGFVHRDLKPENIFVSGTRALLGDFGLAIAMPSAAPAAATGNADAGSSPVDDALDRSCSVPVRCRPSSTCSNGGAGGCAAVAARPANLRQSASAHDLTATAGGSSSSSSTAACRKPSQGGIMLTRRRSSSCGAINFDCSVIPQLGSLQASGTAAYSAPEVVGAAFNNTPAADVVGPQNDVWSLAVLVFECLSGCHPFGDPSMSPGAFLCNIISKPQPHIDSSIEALPVSQACKDWLSLALSKDPTFRASAVQLLEHSWLSHTTDTSGSDQQQQQQEQKEEGQEVSNPHSFGSIAAGNCAVWQHQQLTASSRGWETAAAAAVAAAAGVPGGSSSSSSNSSATSWTAASGSASCQLPSSCNAAAAFSCLGSISSWED